MGLEGPPPNLEARVLVLRAAPADKRSFTLAGERGLGLTAMRVPTGRGETVSAERHEPMG